MPNSIVEERRGDFYNVRTNLRPPAYEEKESMNRENNCIKIKNPQMSINCLDILIFDFLFDVIWISR